MLEIKDLHVKVQDKYVLKGVNLKLEPDETFVLFGPNGSGKTSLLMSLMGFGGYEVVQGKIYFKDRDITHMPIYERARLGMGMSFQRPPTINGLKTKHMIQVCTGNSEVDIDELAEQANLKDFLDRDVNSGFSGGEIKRSELLQLLAQKPELVLFDEPESGVDLENISLIGKLVRRLLEQDIQPRPDVSMKELKSQRKTAGLIITHTGHILDYINADRGMVMSQGVLCGIACPREILEQVREYGYEEC